MSMDGERSAITPAASGAKVVDLPSRIAARRHGEAAARPAAGAADAAGDGALRTIAVASGKGGVGKTNIVVNLAVALARRGKRVIVLDADLGLANVDTLLGLHPRATLRHVLLGECELGDVLVPGPAGIQVVPAASGFEELTRLSEVQALHLLGQFDRLEGTFDVLLIDTAAGISSNVLLFSVAAQETLVVLTPEPTSLTDAYALVKVLSTRYAERSFGVLVNMVRDAQEATRTFAHLAQVADRFLRVDLHYQGWLPWDRQLTEAVRRQRTMLDFAPGASVTRAFETVADQLLAAPLRTEPKGALQLFFRRLVEGRAS